MRSRHKPGQFVPESGIYKAIHSGHRLTHEVTVRQGGIFPKCRKCQFDVRFALVRLSDVIPIVADQPLTGMLVPFDHEEDGLLGAAASS